MRAYTFGVSDSSPDTSRPPVAGTLLWVLALASGLAPLATDMYLPALPDMVTELGTTTSTVQLTLSGFLLGMGAGQYVIGALSDRLGRRGLFLLGLSLALGAGVISAIAGNVWILVFARFLMGLGLSAGAVLGRAIISDRTTGTQLGQQLSLMMVIQSAMPIAAPALGSLLVPVIGWRGTMWVLAAASAVFLALVWRIVPETLPEADRHTEPLGRVLLAPVKLLSSARFLLLTVAFSAGFGLIFAYISASSYVLQEVLGLETLQYGLVFAINAIVMTAAASLNAKLVERMRFTSIILAGLVVMMAGVVGVLAEALAGPTLVGLVFFVSLESAGLGVVLPNVTTLLMQEAQDRGQDGAGSAMIGAAQAVAAAVVGPLVGLGGESTAVPMALVMAACALIALSGTGAAARLRRGAAARHSG